uniref:Nardilysin-like isoform X2 n=1 Tax=Elaeis guineensis var. tenera TaxID=51953 RepID=A0A6I9R665_ELAGV|nr:nardilysin-like isoform X2 [Elaeis guineensis]
MVHRVSERVVIKSPTDRRSYRIIHLSNGLMALLVHDPEIYPDGFTPQEESEGGAVGADVKEGDEDGDLEEDGEDDFDEEEYESEEGEEDGEEGEEDGDESEQKRKKGTAPTKKAAAAMCVGVGSFSDPSKAQGLAHFLEHMLFMGSSRFPDENEYDSYLSKHGGSSNAYTETEYTCYHFEVNREHLMGALKRFSQFFISPLVKAEAMEREVLAVDSEFNQVLQSDSCRLFQLHCHTSIPGHPFNRFTWGNKKSLIDAMENGINLREEILQMYRDNYHGGMMKLVVIGGEPLDILEGWVVELFSDVKTGPPLKMSTRIDIPIWKVGKIYRLEAVKDVHILELTWKLPCLHKEYLKKPEDYLAHLLGHEGRGSLLYFFKAKGWATSLSAGVGDEGMRRSSIAYIFVMSIHLTDSGLEMLYEVIGFVYQYIKLLRQSTPQEWIFKELQDIGNMEFRFAEEQPQDDYAAELAENLLLYSEEHIIFGEYVFELWDPELVEHVLSFFTPENMRIDILSKSFDKHSEAIQYEPWFGSRYIEEDISPSLLKLWSDPPEIHQHLHLPLKNEFIPRVFSLCNSNISKCLLDTNHPKCIMNQPLMKVWYKIDLTFNVPRANTYFLITVKDGYNSVKNCVLTELFVNLLKDELNEILYQVIKEDMERAFRNCNMKPLSHSSYLRLQVLREKFWDVDDKLSCFVNLSLSDLEAFIPNLLSQLHIEGLCHGNLLEEEAINISNIFTNIFSVEPLAAEFRHQERVLCLPSGASLIRSVRVKNDLEVNSVVELYFQIEQDVGMEANKLRAITDLFSDIVEEPCFDQLRTKEQLGYVVQCGPRMTYRVLGFCFLVQSSEYSPIYLHDRIDNFISGLQELLDKLDDESFENHRNGLIAEKLEKFPSLAYETGDHWSQIVAKRYLFDMLKVEAEELKTIQKSDVINWYKTYLRPPSPKCRQLAVHVWGCNTNFNEELKLQEKFGQVIEDVDSFKMSSEFYPSLC